MLSFLDAKSAFQRQQQQQYTPFTQTQLPSYYPPDTFQKEENNNNRQTNNNKRVRFAVDEFEEAAPNFVRGASQVPRDTSLYSQENGSAFGGPYSPFLNTSSSVGGIGPLPNYGSGSRGYGLGDSANQRRFEQMTGLGEYDKPRRATIVMDHPTEPDIRLPGEVDAGARMVLAERAKSSINPNSKNFELPFVQEKDTSDRTLPFDGRTPNVRDRYTEPVGLHKPPELKARNNRTPSVQVNPNVLFSTQPLLSEFEMRSDRATHNERKPFVTPTAQTTAAPTPNNYIADPIGKLQLHPHTDRFGTSRTAPVSQSNDSYRYQQPGTVPTRKMDAPQFYQGGVQPTDATFAGGLPTMMPAAAQSAENSGVRKHMTEQSVHQPGVAIPALGAPSMWNTAPSSRLLNPSFKQATELERFTAGVEMPRGHLPAAAPVWSNVAMASKPSFQQTTEQLQYQGKTVAPNVASNSFAGAMQSSVNYAPSTFKQSTELLHYNGVPIELAPSVKNANLQNWYEAAQVSARPGWQQGTEQLQYQGKNIDRATISANTHGNASTMAPTPPSKKQVHESDVFMPSQISTAFPMSSQASLSDLYRKHHLTLVPQKQNAYETAVRTDAPHSQHTQQNGALSSMFSLDSSAAIGSRRQAEQERHTQTPAQLQHSLGGPRINEMLKTMRIRTKANERQAISSQAAVLGSNGNGNHSSDAAAAPRFIGVSGKEAGLADQEQQLEQVAMRSFVQTTPADTAISNLPRYELFGQMSSDAGQRRLQTSEDTADRNNQTDSLRLDQLAKNPFVKNITTSMI